IDSSNANGKRNLSYIGSILSQLPLLLGLFLHMRATSSMAADFQLLYDTSWGFVGVMVLVAFTNRLSAYLLRTEQPGASSLHFFLSAGAVLIAAAGLLSEIGWTDWAWQAPPLMLIPILYIIASRLWRGHSPETPLARVAHASTAVIVLGSFLAAIDQKTVELVTPLVNDTRNLLLGLTFIEASVFYTLAWMFRKRSWNAYFATAAACGAIWQFLGYFGVPTVWHELLFAVLGLGIIALSRTLGVAEEVRYSNSGEPMKVARGRGLTAFQSGNAVLSISLLITFFKGLSELAQTSISYLDFTVLLLMAGAAGAAMTIVPLNVWKRWYATAVAGLIAVALLQLNVLFDLSGWRKLELLCIAIGIATLVAGHIGRFGEEGKHEEDSVTAGLWFGSILAALPMFIAVCYYRFKVGTPSLPDELALVTLTVIMLATGCSWKIMGTTLIGGGTLFIYLLILIGSIVYQPQIAIGVYLFIGGGLIFAMGVLLSIYRERLLAIPEQIAKQEGLFKIMSWR
ncbi:MAG: hypothetical protein AB7O26_15385, partial [Planctomycetaceae bacterium]